MVDFDPLDIDYSYINILVYICFSPVRKISPTETGNIGRNVLFTAGPTAHRTDTSSK